MEFFGNEWLQFLLRWIHLIAGISWIGNSFYFMWLDAAIQTSATQTPSKNPHLEGEIWMIHGGGYYRVEKHKMRPGALPPELHWFKWEATFTWISGFFLLIAVYYLSGGSYLLDPAVSAISVAEGITIGVGSLFGSWLVYDLLWQSPLGKSPRLATLISAFLGSALVYGLTQTLSGRAAYLHAGAVFGTLMVLNVWVRILPAQRRMIERTEKGQVPDYDEGARAKWRSTHNSYMTLPVLFAMLSNHFPTAYGHSQKALILILLCLLGGVVRHMMLGWNKGKTGLRLLLPIGILLALLVWITFPRTSGAVSETVGDTVGETVTFEKAFTIVRTRCVSCHSKAPTDDIFKINVSGVNFEDPQQMKISAPRILERVFVTKTMPLANKTQMTDEERKLLADWVKQGALIP